MVQLRCVGVGRRALLVRNIVGRGRFEIASWLEIFYRRELEWLHTRNIDLIASLDGVRFSGIQLIKEMNVAVKFFCDRFGSVAIGEEF